MKKAKAKKKPVAKKAPRKIAIRRTGWARKAVARQVKAPRVKGRVKKIGIIQATGRRAFKRLSVRAIKDFEAGSAPIGKLLPLSMRELPADQITIGKRYRKKLLKLKELAASIDARGGLLHALPITREGVLIAGGRRLAAWKLSRFAAQPIPVRVIDIDLVLAGEHDENSEREPLQLSESVALMRELEPIMRERARAIADAKATGAKPAPGRKTGRNTPVRAADLAAKATGRHRTTVAKAAEVVDAAKADPEKYGKLQEQMDATGRAEGPYRQLQNLKQAEAIAALPPPLPGRGPYRAIVVDFPWPADLVDYERDPAGRGYYSYPTMSLEACAEFARTAIAGLCDPKGCALWLLIPNFHLARGVHLPIVKAAGFEDCGKTILTWGKDKAGRGKWLRGKTEQCVLLIKGDVRPSGTSVDSLLMAAANHKTSGEKPIEFYRLVEKVTPAPRYASLFAGKLKLGDRWDCHGDRVEVPAEVAPGAPPAAAGKPPRAKRKLSADEKKSRGDRARAMTAKKSEKAAPVERRQTDIEDFTKAAPGDLPAGDV